MNEEMAEKLSQASIAADAQAILSDEALEVVTGGALPKWWLDGAAEALKKSDHNG